MFLFALRVCDPQFLNREVIYLKILLFLLGYPKRVLDEKFSETDRTYFNPLVPLPKDEDSKVISPPITTDATKFQHIFHCHKTNVVYTKYNSLRKHLVILLNPRQTIQMGVACAWFLV